jgi:orotate phosphoribosyltransferase
VNLFWYGDFKLHSGEETFFKIDCDALSDEDLDTLARLATEMLTTYCDVEGVPTGGTRFAKALEKYAWKIEGAVNPPLLIVDDVLTTGASMEEQRAGRKAQGIVIFARGQCPDWVKAIFKMEDT